MKTLIFIHGGESFSTKEEYLDWIEDTYPEWMLDAWAPKEEKMDWKMEIAEISTQNGDTVYMPQFPNKLNAKYDEWKIFFDAWIGKIVLSDEIIFIGNSLGGCFLLKYFSEQTPFAKGGRGDFVSENPEQNPQSPHSSSTAPLQKELTIHLLAACIEAGDFTPPEHYEFLQEMGNRVHIWHSEDDTVVPFSVGQELARILPEAQTHFFPSEK